MSGRARPTVTVRDVETGELSRWEVWGESEPCYYAEPSDGGAS